MTIPPRSSPPLTFSQHLTVASARMFFGVITSAVRLTRGLAPEGWETLRYGTHRDETLDHLPAGDGAEVRAPVVFFHGGGWMMGSTDAYSHDLLFLGEAGYPVFNVEYPKAPETGHPWILRSVFKALAFIRTTFPDVEAVHLMGDSAGGNLAIMAALKTENPELLKAIDPSLTPGDLPRVLSVTSLYGVYDRATCLDGSIFGADTMIESYAGPGALGETVDEHHAITPMDLAFTKHPPCLLICGESDPLLASQEIYATRLKKSGHKVTTKVYPGAIHAFFNLTDSRPKAASRADILKFLNGL
ncbi:MAG: alpha/beta hydrolase [Rhodospirillaceae bacterium]|nr:alpha/beta hydrolase [Rhodospirillaceae bacterium]